MKGLQEFYLELNESEGELAALKEDHALLVDALCSLLQHRVDLQPSTLFVLPQGLQGILTT